MEAAISLLITAQALLSFVSGNATLPPAVVESATEIAKNAIIIAQDEISKIEEELAARNSEPIIVHVEPVVEVTYVPAPLIEYTQTDPLLAAIETMHIEIQEKAIVEPSVERGYPLGAWFYNVGVFNEEGVGEYGAEITMTVGDKVITKTANGRSTRDTEDWTASFDFIPEEKGEYTLVFTSGETTAQVHINVK